MPLADLTLSRRLEEVEGNACAQFASARARLFPDSGAEWMRCAGAYAVFDGAASPITQTFGLGIFEELTPTSLQIIERFFFDRGAPVQHEVSPLAGVAALDLLCARGYRPIEISNVLYRSVEAPAAVVEGPVRTRVAAPEEMRTWNDVCARGWTHEHPELLDFCAEGLAISASRKDSPCFIGEVDGVPGAAASLYIRYGVALFAGAATVPELRRRGLQAALLAERLRYAFGAGCDLAMMVAEAGSESQRNAERKGFRIAYTRLKWQLLK